MSAPPGPPPSRAWEAALTTALAERRAAGRERRLTARDSAAGPHTVWDGTTLLQFASNDYLGLAAHPDLTAALADAARGLGVGAGAAALLGGRTQAQAALEEELAAFLGRERALIFSTGYHANLGTLATLAGRGDAVFLDRLCHASLVDGAILSRARIHRYRHADADALAAQLARHATAATTAAHPGTRPGWAYAVTESIFSMDGDLAPLPALAAAARAAGAILMVDDAHGIGVLGPGGRGALAHFGLDEADVPVLVGTFGKAFGGFGAFAAGRAAVIDTLVQSARTFIYTTALPPALVAALRCSLGLVAAADPARAHLAALVARFRIGAAVAGLPQLPGAVGPIQPILLGGEARALAVSQDLRARGLHVLAIRPPTVAVGTARLRISFSAAHSPAQVDALIKALAEALAAHPA